VHQLTELLKRLRDKGNSVLVVEHDPDVISVAQHIVELGPGAGAEGGKIVYQGELAGLKDADTLTSRSFHAAHCIKANPRQPKDHISIRHQSMFNVHDVSVDIPLGVITVIAGVAGSGKSTLVDRILPRVVSNIVRIDQSSLGGSSRSAPASYLGVLDPIRRHFARATGRPVGLFSANSLGACPVCNGTGVVKTDLAFLESVETVCEACEGTGYSDEARSVRINGVSIADVMNLRAPEACRLFRTDRAIAPALKRMEAVGLNYLMLGQRLSTLSGGERQRLKLARELAKPGRIYVFDEPTTGLHMADVHRLIELFEGLVRGGDTVIIVEHNVDVIAAADHIIEMGPGAGK